MRAGSASRRGQGRTGRDHRDVQALLGRLGVPVPLVAGWVLLGYGNASAHGTYLPAAILCVTLALVATLFAAVRTAPSTAPAQAWRPALATALVMAAVSAVPPATYLVSNSSASVAHGASLVGGLAATGWLWLPARLRGWVWPVTAALTTAGAVALIHATPHPAIDVWNFLQDATQALPSPRHLYATCWPHDLDLRTRCVFAYPPGTALLLWPFHAILGDVRYAYVAATLLAALLVRRIAGPGLGTPTCCLLLVFPRALFGVEEAWTEPLLLAAIALMVWAILVGRTGWAVVAFAGALVTKQYALLLAPIAAWCPRFGARRTAVSVLLAVAVSLPWIVADPPAFFRGTVGYHVHLPARLDSLSLYATGIRHGLRPSLVAVAALTAMVLALCLTRLPRTLFGFVLASTATLFTFDYLNKQSFFNHYQLVLGLLVLALATHAAEGSAAGEQVAQPGRRDVPAPLGLDPGPTALPHPPGPVGVEQ